MSDAGAALAAEADRLAPAVASRLDAVRERIRAAGGDVDGVTVLAVTKGFGPAVSLAALRAGLSQVGENYAEELLEKAAVLAGEAVEWHFIGRIQRNKVGRLAPVVACWQSVSRPAEVAAIAARTGARPPGIFIEANLALDPTRPGARLEEIPALVETAAAALSVRGLMAVAPLGAGQVETGRLFRKLAALNGSLGLSELSIGMSGDLEEAVRAGSTMVRVGTALFGERDSHAPRRVLQE